MMKLLGKRATVVDSSAARPLVACHGDITFENVTFSYDERRFPLNRLSLNCRAGTTTAFVGESGEGKSTIFRLLSRFYQSQEGYITVDGHDVRNITIDSLRKHIGGSSRSRALQRFDNV
jgi:ABC-type transport system involved in Fe-S cluster assembly fused permease/ATPase subunit